MTTSKLKKELHTAIDSAENQQLLKAMYTLLKKEARHAELVLPGEPMSPKQLTELLKESEEDYKAGYFYTHEEVKAMSKKWIKKATK